MHGHTQDVQFNIIDHVFVHVYIGSMMTILLMAGEQMYSSPNFHWNQMKTTERSF